MTLAIMLLEREYTVLCCFLAPLTQFLSNEERYTNHECAPTGNDNIDNMPVKNLPLNLTDLIVHLHQRF